MKLREAMRNKVSELEGFISQKLLSEDYYQYADIERLRTVLIPSFIYAYELKKKHALRRDVDRIIKQLELFPDTHQSWR